MYRCHRLPQKASTDTLVIKNANVVSWFVDMRTKNLALSVDGNGTVLLGGYNNKKIEN